MRSLSLIDRSPLWRWADVDELFDRAFESAAATPWELTETEGGYLMAIDLPGVRKEDLKIEVVEQTLTVSGERKRANEADGRKLFYRFTIPSAADAGKIEARLENGVLEIALPKAEAAKPRSVEIQSGGGGVFSKLLGGIKEQ